jgi:hypothetical protein
MKAHFVRPTFWVPLLRLASCSIQGLPLSRGGQWNVYPHFWASGSPPWGLWGHCQEDECSPPPPTLQFAEPACRILYFVCRGNGEQEDSWVWMNQRHLQNSDFPSVSPALFCNYSQHSFIVPTLSSCGQGWEFLVPTRNLSVASITNSTLHSTMVWKGARWVIY